MAGFSYDLGTHVGQVRLALGDTMYGSGVRPDGTNLDDSEIECFLTQEGDDVDMATARACEVLATMWAGQADLTVGPRNEKLSQVAQRYAERAQVLRTGTLQGGRINLGFAATWSDTEWA
jgi:hypothetical protein